MLAKKAYEEEVHDTKDPRAGSPIAKRQPTAEACFGRSCGYRSQREYERWRRDTKPYLHARV